MFVSLCIYGVVFALHREGSEVYAMILGAVVSSAGRRFPQKKKEVTVFTATIGISHGPRLWSQLPNKDQEQKHICSETAWEGERRGENIPGSQTQLDKEGKLHLLEFA